MDDVARSHAQDRAAIIATSAATRGIRPELIEKDFWVCWALKRLFTLPDPPAALIFKGGTSLSKVYGVIHRFSEDIDLGIHRADLGFAAEADPMNAPNPQKRVNRLRKACREMVRDTYLPRLANHFAKALGSAPGDGWSLAPAEDADRQSLLFVYPGGVVKPAPGEQVYNPPAVLMEFGARSDQSPAGDATISPYAAEDVTPAFKDPICHVRVLAAERTFWEKATALHVWAHDHAAIAGQRSRHYYDIVMLAAEEVGQRALRDTALLAAVVRHKQVFFPSERYDLATPGTFRLVPDKDRLPELKRDYEAMSHMFFKPPPAFERLLDALGALEASINGFA